MSSDPVHYAWANENGMYTVYAGCGLRTLCLRVTEHVENVTCPNCQVSQLYLDACAQAAEDVLKKPRSSWAAYVDELSAKIIANEKDPT